MALTGGAEQPSARRKRQFTNVGKTSSCKLDFGNGDCSEFFFAVIKLVFYLSKRFWVVITLFGKNSLES